MDSLNFMDSIPSYKDDEEILSDIGLLTPHQSESTNSKYENIAPWTYFEDWGMSRMQLERDEATTSNQEQLLLPLRPSSLISGLSNLQESSDQMSFYNSYGLEDGQHYRPKHQPSSVSSTATASRSSCSALSRDSYSSVSTSASSQDIPLRSSMYSSFSPPSPFLCDINGIYGMSVPERQSPSAMLRRPVSMLATDIERSPTPLHSQIERLAQPTRRKSAASFNCFQCPSTPAFRGAHELKRHVEVRHEARLKRYVCREPSSLGIESPYVPLVPLSRCKACTSGKRYNAHYNAAAHLRRIHFNPRVARGSVGRVGGVGGGDWPPMGCLLQVWIGEVDGDNADAESDTVTDGGDDGVLLLKGIRRSIPNGGVTVMNVESQLQAVLARDKRRNTLPTELKLEYQDACNKKSVASDLDNLVEGQVKGQVNFDSGYNPLSRAEIWLNNSLTVPPSHMIDPINYPKTIKAPSQYTADDMVVSDKGASPSGYSKATESDEQDDGLGYWGDELYDMPDGQDVIPHQVKMLFLANLLLAFSQSRQFEAIHTCGRGAGDDSQSNSGVGASSSQQQQQQQNTQTAAARTNGKKRAPKRKQNQQQDDEDEDGQEQRKRRPSANSPTSDSASNDCSPLLACPFYKWKPLVYTECQNHILRTVARVKQHLDRRHQIPIHCPSCNTKFKKEHERDDHLRQRPPCEIQLPVQWDGITKQQAIQLQFRSDAKTTASEQWYELFKILFPGHPLPDSPYMDQIKTQQLKKLQEFMGQDWPEVYEQLVERHIPREYHEQEAVMRPFMNSLFQNAITIIFKRYENSPPSTASLGSPDSGYASHARAPASATSEASPTLQRTRVEDNNNASNSYIANSSVSGISSLLELNLPDLPAESGSNTNVAMPDAGIPPLSLNNPLQFSSEEFMKMVGNMTEEEYAKCLADVALISPLNDWPTK